MEGIGYEVIEDIAQEPVTVSFLKQHTRIDFNTDDALVGSYLKSARQELEKFAQLSFVEKKIRFTALRVYSRYKLMYGPYVSVDTAGYTLFGKDILLEGGTNVDIELTSGWGTVGLPENIKIAICMRAAGNYALREDKFISINGVPHTYEQLYDEAEKKLRGDMNVTWP